LENARKSLAMEKIDSSFRQKAFVANNP